MTLPLIVDPAKATDALSKRMAAVAKTLFIFIPSLPFDLWLITVSRFLT
jgi:hypothetical protein